MRGKLWLGIGAFALVQSGNVVIDQHKGVQVTAAPATAEARSWNERGWRNPCGPNQRWVVRNGFGECHDIPRYGNQRGVQKYWDGNQRYNQRYWNERGERGRWNERGERGRGQWQHGEKGERWGERG